MEFQLDRDGYLTKYLIAGRREQEFESGDRDSDQLRYERHLRGLVADHGPIDLSAPVRIGAASPIGEPWSIIPAGICLWTIPATAWN